MGHGSQKLERPHATWKERTALTESAFFAMTSNGTALAPSSRNVLLAFNRANRVRDGALPPKINRSSALLPVRMAAALAGLVVSAASGRDETRRPAAGEPDLKLTHYPAV